MSTRRSDDACEEAWVPAEQPEHAVCGGDGEERQDREQVATHVLEASRDVHEDDRDIGQQHDPHRERGDIGSAANGVAGEHAQAHDGAHTQRQAQLPHDEVLERVGQSRREEPLDRRREDRLPIEDVALFLQRISVCRAESDVEPVGARERVRRDQSEGDVSGHDDEQAVAGKPQQDIPTSVLPGVDGAFAEHRNQYGHGDEKATRLRRG